MVSVDSKLISGATNPVPFGDMTTVYQYLQMIIDFRSTNYITIITSELQSS